MTLSMFDFQWKIARLQEIYEKRLTTVNGAMRKIKPGNRIFIGTGCAEPQYLTKNLGRFRENIADTEILQLISLSTSPYTKSNNRDMFRLNTFFIGTAARESVRKGEADYTPIFLSEIPKLIQNRRLHIDVALVQVTTPDPFGNCSLGMSVETVKAAIEAAPYVVAQVNPSMPRTLGDSFVNIEQLDAIIEFEEDVLEYPVAKVDSVADRIGYYVSRLVPNGATIQAGIGKIPDATLKHLKDKKDLGVHTEMFSDNMAELYKLGVITNRKKTFHRDKIVAAFCMGSRDLYDLIDNNPTFHFHPTDYVSDPRNIALNDNMVAINSALEIDLTGQVCSDSLGPYFYSGIGGQADFIRGSSLAKNGRPIIAIPSTAKNDEISRIVPMLTPGAGVVTTRGDVHYVVTEYGVAYLHGKSIRERALALINIAHPKFRAKLIEEAKKLHYIYADQVLPEHDEHFDPGRYRWNYTTAQNETIDFTTIKAVDEENIRRLFYSMTAEDVYYRFMGTVKTLPHAKALPLVALDLAEKFAVVGYYGDEGNREIVGVGRWFLDQSTNMAEVAFTVQPKWQRRGIGAFLQKILIEVAQEKGIRGFTAEVLSSNRKMMNVFYKNGYDVHTRLEEGMYFISFTFDSKKEPQTNLASGK